MKHDEGKGVGLGGGQGEGGREEGGGGVSQIAVRSSARLPTPRGIGTIERGPHMGVPLESETSNPKKKKRSKLEGTSKKRRKKKHCPD